jgi:low affinity Fe/Cu permease
MYWFVPIVVAVITGPVVVILQRLRKENTDQHAESRGLLEHMVVKVDNIHDKLDEHIRSHDG